jgi:FtsH-binding integral membrane protein
MRRLLRDTFIIWMLTFLVGFVIGIAKTVGVISPTKEMIAIAVGNFLFGIVGFTIVGAMTKLSRFTHLFKVLLALWIISLVNLLGPFTFTQWLLGFPFLLVTMGIGGAISLLFVPSKPSTPSEVKD